MVYKKEESDLFTDRSPIPVLKHGSFIEVTISINYTTLIF
jgi:hypothetical protein